MRLRSIEVDQRRCFFWPGLLRLADYVLLNKIPIFNIEKEPLIGVNFHGSTGILIPIRCFFCQEDKANIFEDEDKYFMWRCYDILCNVLGHSFDSDDYNTYIFAFIQVRDNWDKILQ